MQIGVRQRIILLIFTGLFVTMGLIGSYRYGMEKRSIMKTTRVHGEQSCKLMSELAEPFLLTSDYSGLAYLAEHFMHTPDAQELTITDREGRQLVHVVKPSLSEGRMAVGPCTVTADQTGLGDVRLAVYPAELDKRLRAYAVSALIEHLFIFAILAGIISLSVSRTITAPVKELGSALKDMIDRKDFTLRVKTGRRDEIGALASGLNYLIERLEQFVIEMGVISGRINELSPKISGDSHEVKKNSEAEADAFTSVFSSMEEVSSSIRTISESADGLSASAAEASSAVLEMSITNHEVTSHVGLLTASVEDVTTSVLAMIESVREIAGHAEALSSAAEETSASAVQIEASIREVERAAQESARLSQQVSAEVKGVGATAIHETMNAMDTIKGAVERYSSMVTRLGKRSEEIGKILGVIVDVTERTNLLALNAAILAAQAGEHGKGFAVVAEEIKALAERTAGSAQDIAKLISTVQKETKEAVGAMAESLTAVERGVRRSRDAGAALDKVLESSGRSAETAVVIERAMAEQTRGIKQVSEAVAHVKQMMNQIAAATQAQSQGTELILKTAEDMRHISRHVRDAMTEQESGSKQISEAAENVTGRAATIASGINEEREASRRILESMERIRDLPRQNIKRMESMVAEVKALREQGELLGQELLTMNVRKGPRDAASGAVRMGVIPLESPAEMYRRFTPLAEYLAGALGRRVELSLSVDFERTLKDLEDGTTDIAFLTPSTYIEARKKFGVVLMVKALRNGLPYTHSAIVTRRGSGIGRLEDMKGKTFAFGDAKSTSSYIIPRYMLSEAGVGLDDLRERRFLGHHDDVARAVLAGEVDAGGLMESVASKFKESGLVVVKTSFDIPEFNICASKNLEQGLAEKMKKSLVALDVRNEEHARLLALINADYTGFAEAADGDYDVIRSVMEKFRSEDAASTPNR